MQSTIFSMEKFLRFMNRATRTGIFDQTQNKEWFRITSDIIGLLTPEEQRDLRTLDIPALENRYAASFAQKNVSVSSWAIFQRKKFLTFAVGEFIAFSVNPSLYVKEQKRKYLKPANEPAHSNYRYNTGNAMSGPDESIGAGRSFMANGRIAALASEPANVRQRLPQTGLRARRETGIEYQTRLMNNPVGRHFLAAPVPQALASV